MRTIVQWIESIFAVGRSPREATMREITEGLDIVAQAMMEGNATMAHADALLSMRFALMDGKAKQAEAVELEAIAATLGRKGGQAKTDAKAEAARANGAKGGRPRKPDYILNFLLTDTENTV